MLLTQEKDATPTIESDPYAELWLGTHPNGPSMLLDYPSVSLLTLIHSTPETQVGTSSNLAKSPKTSLGLPFLLKILSINKVLSIQAHPSKPLAEKLHEEYPKIYTDCNHKPELAIALTDFTAMAGFRPISEILEHIDSYPEFKEVLDEDAVSSLRAAHLKVGGVVADFDSSIKNSLKAVFTSFMSISANEVEFKCIVDKLMERLSTITPTKTSTRIQSFHSMFPYDNGIFSPLLFNILDLTPGQSLFIPAGEPHAYISGDIIECMASSDNVVRCGLTPKFKDVNTLTDMLSYSPGAVNFSNGEEITKVEKLYRPPVEDFEVIVVDVPANDIYMGIGLDSGGIILCLSGSGTIGTIPGPLDCCMFDDEEEDGKESNKNVAVEKEISFGRSFFLSANNGFVVRGGSEGVKFCRAQSNCKE